MSYTVLARKWRPQRFEELVGQEHVQRAIVNAIDQNRLHHAYLFTGTRGVGKTTIARIFSKCLNCHQGITSKPCGTCDVCVDIEQGNFIDLIEVDAASRTKVEDTREILDNVQYRPSRGRYKVYLIDEVHMLSNSSFNALLKTLEEPPPHVIFLLATTDPQKLPVTVLSRCLQFHLKRMSKEAIVDHLSHILGKENIENDASSLGVLAESADGSMRDALSLLDQAIAYGGGRLVESDVRQMLGVAENRFIDELLMALSENNPQKCLSVVAELADYSPDYQSVLMEILSRLHQLAVSFVLGTASENDVELSHEDIQLFYQLGVIARKELSLVTNTRQGFEMVLLRMLAFRPQRPNETQVNRPINSDVAATAVNEKKKNNPVVDVNKSQEALSIELKTEALKTEAQNLQTHNGSTASIPNESQPKVLSQSKESEPTSNSEAMTNTLGKAETESLFAEMALSEPSLTDKSSRELVEESLNEKTVSQSRATQEQARRDIFDEASATNVEHDAHKESPIEAVRAEVSSREDHVSVEMRLELLEESVELNPKENAHSENLSDKNDVRTEKSKLTVDDFVGSVEFKAGDSESVQSSSPKPKESKGLERISVYELDLDAVKNDLNLLSNVETWYEFIHSLNLTGTFFQIINNSIVASVEGNVIQVNVTPSIEHFCSENTIKKVTVSMSAVLGKSVSLVTSTGTDSMRTPKIISEEIHQQNLENSLQDFNSDDKVKRLLQEFDARITIDDIRLNASI